MWLPLADVSPTVVVTDPPEWVPDEACGFCTACKAPFTVIRRKHHCRSCGKVGGMRWCRVSRGHPQTQHEGLEVRTDAPRGWRGL